LDRSPLFPFLLDVTPSLRADQTPSGWLPADSSIVISILLKATDDNDFPFFYQPFIGMTDDLTSFHEFLTERSLTLLAHI